LLKKWVSRRRASTPSRSGKIDRPWKGPRNLILPIHLRSQLKNPLGELFRGEPFETIERLRIYLTIKPPLFASVGDFVTKNAIDAGLNPDIIIIDGKTLRVEVPFVNHELEELKVVNPAATIQAETWKALLNAITLKRKLAVVVEGEEDLLVLPLMAEAPTGSVIIYGQPHEGLVVITVTDERRRWAKGFLDQMEEKKSETRPYIN
jgi:GTP-dependent dephospho-CoA kinase